MSAAWNCRRKRRVPRLPLRSGLKTASWFVAPSWVVDRSRCRAGPVDRADCLRGRNRMALAGVVGHRRGGVVVLILVRLRRAAAVQIGGPGDAAVAGQVEVRVVLVGRFVAKHVAAPDD